jgi:hypothetical protein
MKRFLIAVDQVRNIFDEAWKASSVPGCNAHSVKAARRSLVKYWLS